LRDATRATRDEVTNAVAPVLQHTECQRRNSSVGRSGCVGICGRRRSALGGELGGYPRNPIPGSAH
jgi:hypothetical protein